MEQTTFCGKSVSKQSRELCETPDMFSNMQHVMLKQYSMGCTAIINVGVAADIFSYQYGGKREREF